MMTNWKTTISGVVTILGAGVHFYFAVVSHSVTEQIIMETITAVTAGIGLIHARDFDKSSEQSGAGNTGGK